MRDDDPGEGKTIDAELRDIHHRIDTLKAEGESNHKTLLERLHAIEVRLAAGWRFPVAGWGALVLVLGAVGTTYLKVEVGNTSALKALGLIEEHLKAAPAHRYNVESMAKFADELRDRIPALESSVSGIQATIRDRLVGNTSEGWHRRDHELYAEGINARMLALDQRLSVQENRSAQRDNWWQRVWESGVLKGQKP
jgi:hypothetical protein